MTGTRLSLTSLRNKAIKLLVGKSTVVINADFKDGTLWVKTPRSLVQNNRFTNSI